MKKVLLFLSLSLIIPSVVSAEEIINNGDVVTPIGTVSVYAGIESDSQLLDRGYLIANGASISKTEYPELYAIIGTTYGSVDDTHFNLPDLRGRAAVGVDADDADFKTLGQKGGEKTVTLTVEQIPAHTHTFTGTASTTSVESNTHTHTFSGTTSSNGAHGHTTIVNRPDDSSFVQSAPEGITALTGQWLNEYTLQGIGNSGIVSSGAHTHTFTGTTSSTSTTHTHTFTATGKNSETGGSKAHNNMQPYIALKYIIKVKNVTNEE